MCNACAWSTCSAPSFNPMSKVYAPVNVVACVQMLKQLRVSKPQGRAQGADEAEALRIPEEGVESAIKAPSEDPTMPVSARDVDTR